MASSIGPDHVEGLLGQRVALAVDDHVEPLDRVLERDVLAGRAGEHFRDAERLRQEALDLARAGDGELVLGRELVHPQDRDDVAQFLVPLQRLLDVARAVVVLLADDVRVHLARRRVERVDRRVDAERRDIAREHDRRVEVAEGRRRRRVGQVVGRHVHGLDRRDRAGLGRRDPLLQPAHLLGQRRLVAHGRRHPPEQRRALGPREREAVDVVDEEQHVAALVAEALGDREAGQRDAEPVARRLVHLAVHHRHLRLAEVVAVDHAGVHHLVIEVVALARALADAREHRTVPSAPWRCC